MSAVLLLGNLEFKSDKSDQATLPENTGENWRPQVNIDATNFLDFKFVLIGHLDVDVLFQFGWTLFVDIAFFEWTNHQRHHLC